MISPVRIWRRQATIRSLLNKQGKVIAYTTIMVPGTDFKQYAPYMVAVVEFDNGERATGPVVDTGSGEPQIGDKVVAILRKVRQTGSEDVIAYGVKFRPLTSRS